MRPVNCLFCALRKHFGRRAQDPPLPAQCGRGAGQRAGGPARLEIVAAAGAVNVEDFAGEKQARTNLRLHRLGFDLGYVYAAASHRRLGNRSGSYN